MTYKINTLITLKHIQLYVCAKSKTRMYQPRCLQWSRLLYEEIVKYHHCILNQQIKPETKLFGLKPFVIVVSDSISNFYLFYKNMSLLKQQKARKAFIIVTTNCWLLSMSQNNNKMVTLEIQKDKHQHFQQVIDAWNAQC